MTAPQPLCPGGRPQERGLLSGSIPSLSGLLTRELAWSGRTHAGEREQQSGPPATATALQYNHEPNRHPQPAKEPTKYDTFGPNHLPKLQSVGASPLPPLLQIRACLFRNTRLLNIRAVVISTAPFVTEKGRLANALLGQLAFTTLRTWTRQRTGAIKLWPLSSTQAIPNTRPPSAYLRHYAAYAYSLGF